MNGILEFKDLRLVNFVDLEVGEKERIMNMRNDERIRSWMINDRIISLEDHLSFIEKLKNDVKNHYFLVRRNGPIGVISLNSHDKENRRAYLGIYANPELAGKGAGSACMEALLHLAFHTYKLHTLKLEVVSNNTRAINLYKKFGFEQEGRLKDYLFRNERWLDMLVMGIDEDSYGNRAKKGEENRCRFQKIIV